VNGLIIDGKKSSDSSPLATKISLVQIRALERMRRGESRRGFIGTKADLFFLSYVWWFHMFGKQGCETSHPWLRAMSVPSGH
jgi:hypothetical protein